MVSPDRLVPPPRLRIGAPCRLHTRCVVTTSSVVFGTTTPMGIWRKLDASLAYIASDVVPKRTSPSMACVSSWCTATASTCCTDVIPVAAAGSPLLGIWT